ncbi:MAG: hypothetical protein L0Y56_21360 [Nitrospira sp.]|nr:hypothetical protein [Nitrospira sp.]
MSTNVLREIHGELLSLNGELRAMARRMDSMEEKVEEIGKEWSRYKGAFGGGIFVVSCLGTLWGLLKDRISLN